MKLVQKLRKCLSIEEFKKVTEFASIYTRDNEVEKEDDCSNGHFYRNVEKFVEMIQDMFVDVLGEFNEEDLDNYKEWIMTISSAIKKLKLVVQQHEY